MDALKVIAPGASCAINLPRVHYFEVKVEHVKVPHDEVDTAFGRLGVIQCPYSHIARVFCRSALNYFDYFANLRLGILGVVPDLVHVRNDIIGAAFAESKALRLLIVLRQIKDDQMKHCGLEGKLRSLDYAQEKLAGRTYVCCPTNCVFLGELEALDTDGLVREGWHEPDAVVVGGLRPGVDGH